MSPHKPPHNPQETQFPSDGAEIHRISAFPEHY
jgi:hypothetical protein